MQRTTGRPGTKYASTTTNPSITSGRSLAAARTLAAAALASCALLVQPGCMVGPDYHPPRMDMPAEWVSTPGGPGSISPSTRPAAPTSMTSSSRPSTPTAQPAEVVRWWTTFNDPVLDSLVARALESNLDLLQATSRIRAARASRRAVASGLYPNVDTSAAYRRSRAPSTGGRGRDSGVDLFQAGLDASWEVDVFGGVRRGVEASEADVRAAVEDRRDVMVTLVSEVALNYTDLRAIQRELTIARENLVTQRRSTDITRRRFETGLESRLDTVNAEAQVATTEAQIPLLESQARQVIYSISVLLGRQPGALLQELTAEAPIPPTPPEVPVGLPSDLLRRRPDVRRAEANLHAATARVGVATADLFPRFTLNGALNFNGQTVKELANWGNRTWSFGPSVSWPLFDAGRIRANIEVQSAQQEQALLSYRSAVLLALQDVENSLVAYAAEQQHRAALAEAVTANRRAVELSTTLYSAGQIEFITLLLAQRALLNSEDALVQSDRNLAANLISLYKALGGGWEDPAPRRQ
jgi:NodT family efflux transporter outer membrane factor (OMF) lipoprotein